MLNLTPKHVTLAEHPHPNHYWLLCTVPRRTRRQPRSRIVTRINPDSSPVPKSCFSYGALLHRINFAELGTVRGRVYNTFQETAATLASFRER